MAGVIRAHSHCCTSRRERAQEPLPPFFRAMFDYGATMITAERGWLEKAIDLGNP
jgi:hypothetical protein